MKRSLIIIIAMLTLLPAAAGCSAGMIERRTVLSVGTADRIESVTVSSLPEGYSYSFDESDSIGAIVDYFGTLPLIEDYPENPDEYDGMTWVIEFLYADGRTLTVYHFGNMFVRAENGPWYKMAYGDAVRLDEIIGHGGK